MKVDSRAERVPCYCALCISRCGSIALVEDGRFVRLEPDPTHPTGAALCAKGRAAPELVHHAERLLYPIKRTRPTGDPDPGWQRIGWDEALDTTAMRLRVFDFMADQCRRYPPDRVEEICGVSRDAVEQAARMLWEARPVAYYAWSGVEMHTGSTQIARAIAQLYTLTGSFDERGGNVAFPTAATANVTGVELLSDAQRRKALGIAPNVVCGQHGWWQACVEIGAPGYDPFAATGANLNLIIGNDVTDPISGSVPIALTSVRFG